MARAVWIIILLIGCNQAMATAQIMDVMNVEGSELRILTSPLRYVINKDMNAKDILQNNKYECTASWRGYQATWRITDSMLQLISIDIDPCSRKGKKINAGKIFDGFKYPVDATWFSGEIPVQLTTFGIKTSECTSAYFRFDKGVLQGIEIREKAKDCYIF